MNDDWKSITRDSYDKHAKDFALHASVFGGKVEEWVNKFAASFKRGAKVLDIGCGSGRDASYLSSKGFEVIGIDFSSELIKIAKKNAPTAEFLVMDFENMEFDNNSFDGVLAGASLLHVPREKLLPIFIKVYKFMKKDALFFSTFRIGEGARFTIEQRGNADLKRFYSYYQIEELENIFRQAGFNKIVHDQNQDWSAFFARK